MKEQLRHRYTIESTLRKFGHPNLVFRQPFFVQLHKVFRYHESPIDDTFWFFGPMPLLCDYCLSHLSETCDEFTIATKMIPYVLILLNFR